MSSMTIQLLWDNLYNKEGKKLNPTKAMRKEKLVHGDSISKRCPNLQQIQTQKEGGGKQQSKSIRIPGTVRGE